MRAPEPRGQKSVDARESAKRLAARTLNTPDLFATCVKQSATSTHLILRSFVITNRGQENSAFDTGPVPSSSPTNCSIGMPEARESRTAWRSRPTRTLPRGKGLYVFSVPTGLAVKRVEVGLKRGFVVTGPGISEELGPMEVDRLLVGKVIFRGGRM